MRKMLQRRLIFRPLSENDLRVAAYPELSKFCAEAVDLRIVTDDQITVGGWLLKCARQSALPNSQRHLLVLFHGNSGHRACRMGWYSLINDLGVDILAIDYRGYGDSEGRPSETGLRRDASATWRYAVETLRYSPERTLIFGVSLGGAVAVQLASDICRQGVRPAGLAVVASFSSITDVVRWRYPWLPAGWLIVDRFHSDNAIEHVTCPFLHVHGDQDLIIPIDIGRRLFAAAPQESRCGFSKRWVTLPEKGHNLLAESAGRHVRDELDEMLRHNRQLLRTA